jgi:hypothetical protein
MLESGAGRWARIMESGIGMVEIHACPTWRLVMRVTILHRGVLGGER